MSFDDNAPPEKKDTPEEEAESTREIGVFSHVSNFLVWLGELISQQAQIEVRREETLPPLHIIHEITARQEKTSEVIKTAESICNNLDEIKIRLSQEFGATASCFISKCINPMVEHARSLIHVLKQPQSEDKSLKNALDQAIESVELYSQFSDEKKLKKKIVSVAQGFIKQMIEKDLEILANYKQQALLKASILQNDIQQLEFQIDGFLYPIVSELIGMSESHLETDDLHAFLVWKSTVDDRRNSLLELALLTIDAMANVRGESVLARYDDEEEIMEEIVLEEPFPQIIKHQLEDTSLSMSFIATLEDRVTDIFNRLAETHLRDQASIDEIEQLLEYLKVDAERFVKISSHTKHVLDSFKSLRESILQAEHLLTERKTLS